MCVLAVLSDVFFEVFGGSKLPYFKAGVKPAKSSLLQCLWCSKEGDKDNKTDRDKYKDKDKQIKNKDKQIKDKDKQRQRKKHRQRQS